LIHGELSDGGLGDFPHDQIQEFFSEQFHSKIKERYDEVFGGE